MFCPGCGLKEDRAVQYCRTCGTDLRAVRVSVEQPDLIAVSAMAARQEIGRAVADKIREVERFKDLEDVLPEIDKFLESPQEKRLRRMREGVITAASGIGATVFFLIISLAQKNMLFLAGLGLITFLIGLGIIINGMAFTAPKQTETNSFPDHQQRNPLDRSLSKSVPEKQSAFSTSQPATLPPSVVEQTTKHLSSDLIDSPTLKSLP
jgi:hypothetical protein